MTVRSPQRRGAALLMAMVAIAVCGAIAVALVKLAVMQRSQFVVDQRQAQAEWYAEAGADLARAAIAESADYAGETWTINSTDNGRERSATVAVTIDRDAKPPRVVVVAEYPIGELRRSRSRRELPLPPPPGATAVSALQPENRLP